MKPYNLSFLESIKIYRDLLKEKIIEIEKVYNDLSNKYKKLYDELDNYIKCPTEIKKSQLKDYMNKCIKEIIKEEIKDDILGKTRRIF